MKFEEFARKREEKMREKERLDEEKKQQKMQ